MQYDLEIEKAVEAVKKNNAKRVCIQLADGLKPYAEKIQDELLQKTDVKEVIIWAGSCFGGCDTPIGLEKLNIDLLIQFGHNPFIKPEY